MCGVELGHHDGECSFETFLRRYDLDDVALWEIAQIVHEADLGDEHFDAPEAAGLDVLIRGLSMKHDDPELLVLTEPLLDGLRVQATRTPTRQGAVVISWGTTLYSAALSAVAAERAVSTL